MSKSPLPRFFIANSVDGEPQPPTTPVRVVDHFITAGRHRAEAEYVIAIDMNGNPCTIGERELQENSSELHAQLAYSGVTQPLTRSLAINQFYVFTIEYFERPDDAPGFNDPVHLYGNIFGPVPDESAPLATPGQLTVTRADILAGMLASAPYPFHYESTGGLWSRCFNMLLPGGREDETSRGDALILAYPIPTSGVLSADGSNELTAMQLLYDVLFDLRAELERHQMRRHRLQDMILPVPSRRALETQLEGKGYVIKGDVAIRRAGGNNKVVGALSQIFKSLEDRLELPPQATIEQLLDIAKMTLTTLPGWPPPQSRSIQSKTSQASAELMARASSPRGASNLPQIPVCGSTPQRTRKRPEDWLRDFGGGSKQNPDLTPPLPHPKTGPLAGSNLGKKTGEVDAHLRKPASQNSSAIEHAGHGQVSKHAPANVGTGSQPDWMSDFGSDTRDDFSSVQQKQAHPTTREESRKPDKQNNGGDSKKQPPAKPQPKKNEESKSDPDWMDDFK
ncbi:MAG: hypothetical protein K2X77_03995 [Candidatus Obscuribacterales bacterium]|nr:hypothetical protein [Candidatus Obscuribacterales bacterium]